MRDRLPVIARCIAVMGLWLASIASARGQSDEEGPVVVVLVRTPDVGVEAVSSFATILRAQLGKPFVVREVEGRPPSGAQATQHAWAVSVADLQDAPSVLWLRMSDDVAARADLNVFVRGDDGLRTFSAKESRAFDRWRTLSLAASSVLREALEPAGGAEAQATPEAQPAAPPAAVDRESSQSTQEPASEDGRALRPAADPRHETDEAPNRLAWGHILLGPALRMGRAPPLAGFDSQVGVRVHPRALLRLGLELSREQALAAQDATRNRLGFGVRALGTLAFDRASLRAGGGIGTVMSRVTTRMGEDPPHQDVLWASTLAIEAAAAVSVAKDLFIEVPARFDVSLWRASSSGVEAVPAFELTLCIALGFGSL